MSAKRATTTQDKEIGRRVKTRRLDLKMSQTELAEAIGLTFQQVQKYEKGTNRVSAGRLQQIAKVLGVSTGFFFDDTKAAGLNGGGELFALLETSYSLRLMKAFAKITSRRLRQSAVELLEGIAEQTKSLRH